MIASFTAHEKACVAVGGGELDKKYSRHVKKLRGEREGTCMRGGGRYMHEE